MGLSENMASLNPWVNHHFSLFKCLFGYTPNFQINPQINPYLYIYIYIYIYTLMNIYRNIYIHSYIHYKYSQLHGKPGGNGWCFEVLPTSQAWALAPKVGQRWVFPATSNGLEADFRNSNG